MSGIKEGAMELLPRSRSLPQCRWLERKTQTPVGNQISRSAALRLDLAPKPDASSPSTRRFLVRLSPLAINTLGFCSLLVR